MALTVRKARNTRYKVRATIYDLLTSADLGLCVGVMRFLQTEWHRHERDRNAWEIERAEMKSRIGRLEGDLRTSKRLHESLGKHVRLMETALKREREKVKKLSSNENMEDIKDPKEVARDNVNFLKGTCPSIVLETAIIVY
jgi:hypothetical protein